MSIFIETNYFSENQGVILELILQRNKEII
jgi:hypothetical protein